MSAMAPATPPETMTPGGLRAERWRARGRSTRTFVRRFANRTDGVLGFAILLVFAVLAIAPQLFVGTARDRDHGDRRYARASFGGAPPWDR